MARRLYRSKTEKMLSGVCGGIAELFDIDPTLVRLAFVVTTLWGGFGLIVYVILWWIAPYQGEA